MNVQNAYQPCCPYWALKTGICTSAIGIVATSSALNQQVEAYQQDSSPTNLTYEIACIVALVLSSVTFITSAFFYIREKRKEPRSIRIMPTENSQSTVVRGPLEIRLR